MQRIRNPFSKIRYVAMCLCLGWSLGIGHTKRPLPQFRNPGLAESVIGSEDYPGFIYPVCEDKEPNYWWKTYKATGWRETVFPPEVIKVEMKGMAVPFCVLTEDTALPLAYGDTKLLIYTVRHECCISSVYQYHDSVCHLYELYNGVIDGDASIKCHQLPGADYKYSIEIPANHSKSVRGWQFVFESPQRVYPPNPNDKSDTTWRYAYQQLLIMQMPKQDSITLPQLRRSSRMIYKAIREFRLESMTRKIWD